MADDDAPEIKLHVKGALNNGVTVEEIKAALLQPSIPCSASPPAQPQLPAAY
jgi:alkylhydroperoxidase/carboxymuconolactone decarboxylase family protein YurZ